MFLDFGSRSLQDFHVHNVVSTIDAIGTVNRIGDVTTFTIRDRNTGKVSSETFVGDLPFGK